jgi:hypothetical protein
LTTLPDTNSSRGGSHAVSAGTSKRTSIGKRMNFDRTDFRRPRGHCQRAHGADATTLGNCGGGKSNITRRMGTLTSRSGAPECSEGGKE